MPTLPDDFTFSGLRFPQDGSVIDGLSFTVAADERVVLYGPNGGGKTTILRLLAGTIGDDPPGPDTAYMPQTPHMFRGSLRTNLNLGLNETEQRTAFELAGILELGSHLESDARSLSGGQAQRAAIARTLASDAPLVLLDEPLTPINAADRNDVALLIRDRTKGRSLICVTHAIETVVALGDRLLIVDGGSILQDGSPADVLNDPHSDRVADIVGVGNVISGTMTGAKNHMAIINCGAFELVALVDAQKGDQIRVRFGAESVALYASEPSGGSQRNMIGGTVRAVIERGRLLEVVVDAGVAIAALVTPGALDALDVSEGDRVWCVVKTASLSATRIGP